MKIRISLTLTALFLVLPLASIADDKPAAPFVKNVNAEEAAKVLQENKRAVVLDVRTPKEYAAGHIAGATNLDFYAKDFESKLDTLDKQKPYLVHCAAGGRSAKARDLMQKHQFHTIYHLEGGFKAWEKAGKPVEH
jgi:phage shock protein E